MAQRRRQTSGQWLQGKRQRDRDARRRSTREGQDIGELPPVVNPARREAALASFRVFCETYLPDVFYLDWSDDLLKVLAKVEQVVRHHDKLAVAMPRGSGKTQICLAAACWGVLTGEHQYVVFVGAVHKHAEHAIQWFKRQLAGNDLLHEDFPEVCHAIRLLDNDGRKAVGQRYHEERTAITWAKTQLVLPTIEGSLYSGVVMEAVSLDAHIRGLWAMMPDGRVVRPSLAICDDPQTDESARSQGPHSQTETRLKIINETVQGMAGPDTQTAILVPCTVIQPGDLSDQLLNRQLYPEYRGERMKRLYAWPHHKELWEEYRELRDAALRADEPLDEAQEYYRSRMATCGRSLAEERPCASCQRQGSCMDAGARVDWNARLDDKRNLSSLQAAMHSFYKYGPAGFASEFQNEPLADESSDLRLTAPLAMARINGLQRLEVPVSCTEATLGVDVQQSSLWWVLLAWEPNFTGYLIDYGVWPRQKRRTFTLRDVADGPQSLQTVYPGRGVEGTIQAGLEDFLTQMLAANLTRSGGAGLMRIGLAMVDSGKWSSTIQAVKHRVGGATMMLCKGVGIKAGGTPMATRKRKAGEQHGDHWYQPNTRGTREFPYVAVDTNYWKSFIHRALLTAPGDPGAMTLFGNDQAVHALLAAHLTAETYRTPFSPNGVPVDEWTLKPNRPDNHWFDALVYATCAASVRGITLPDRATPGSGRVRKRRVSVDELLARRKQMAGGVA